LGIIGVLSLQACPFPNINKSAFGKDTRLPAGELDVFLPFMNSVLKRIHINQWKIQHKNIKIEKSKFMEILCKIKENMKIYWFSTKLKK